MSSITKIWWNSKKPIYEISQSKLYSQGITSLILDVDGTLLSRKTSNIPIAVKNWIFKSKEYFSIYLVSNNPSIERISKIGNELGLNYKYKAFKPRKKNTLKVINTFEENNKKIAIIGDRILTDIIVGNRCGVNTILVQKLNKKGLPIKINLTLILEKLISLFIF
tara:strand:- start:972 stop:1466 length:495 start_codon:yes stop_codon:yes gene_type:complete